MRTRLEFWMVLLLVLALVGCGGDGGTKSKATHPEVVLTFPEDGAVDVVLNPLVEVWFDQALDEATIDSSAFYVSGARTHRVEYVPDEHAIVLYPRKILEPESTYEVVVSPSLKSTSGDSMLTDFSFSFTTGPLDCAHLEDYMEPNDDVASAPLVDLDKIYPCLSSCGGDERHDYFKFVLESPMRVRAQARYAYMDTVETYWQTTFLRADGEDYCWTGTRMEEGRTPGTTFSFLPGTYYVDVMKYYDDQYIAVYDLEFELSDPCQDDAFEDNDFLDEAVPVTAGTLGDLRGCYVDQDYFSIGLATGQTLSATATQETDLYATRRMEIRNPAGNTVADTTLTAMGGGVSRSWTATEDGVHYIMVRWWANDVDYNLQIDVAD